MRLWVVALLLPAGIDSAADASLPYRRAWRLTNASWMCAPGIDGKRGVGQDEIYELTPESHELTRIGARAKNATDKIPMSTRSNAKKHSYSEFYGPLFEPIRARARNIMEIGVREGGSLLMWQVFFPNANIWGIDVKRRPVTDAVAARHGLKVQYGDGYDSMAVKRMVGDTKFDVVIDDGSHAPWDQARFFNVWKEHVRAPGGLLIAEDIVTDDGARFIVRMFKGESRRMSIVDRTLTKPSYCDERIVLYMV